MIYEISDQNLGDIIVKDKREMWRLSEKNIIDILEYKKDWETILRNLHPKFEGLPVSLHKYKKIFTEISVITEEYLREI